MSDYIRIYDEIEKNAFLKKFLTKAKLKFSDYGDVFKKTIQEAKKRNSIFGYTFSPEQMHPNYIIDDVLVSAKSGIPSRLPGALAVKLTDGRSTAVVNKKFTELAEKAQKAILEHEKGHNELGHKMNFFQTLKRGFGIIPPEELAADMYGAKKIGREFYSGLNKFRKHHEGNTELKKRLKELFKKRKEWRNN